MKISRNVYVVALVALALVMPARSKAFSSATLFVSGYRTVTDVTSFSFGALNGSGSQALTVTFSSSDSAAAALFSSLHASGKPIQTVTLNLYETINGVSTLVGTYQLGNDIVSGFVPDSPNDSVTFSFSTLTYVPNASATCSDATLSGVYGFINTGYETAPTHPSIAVGQITYDGKGNVSGALTHSNGGTISTLTFTGTYLVSKDCTGSTVETQSDGTVIHNNFVIDRKKGTQFIRADPTQIRSGFSLPQGAATCGLTGVEETFAVNVIGSGGTNPAAYVGQVTLDGEGNVLGNGTLSVDGTLSTGPLSGTYTENAGCTGTMQVTPFGGNPANFNFVVVNAGKELLMIETDSGTTISGTAQE